MDIKVICLNMWHGGRIWDNAVDFIKQENPDILLLQEVFNDHDTSLEPRFRTMDEFKHIFNFIDSDFAPACLFVHDFGKVELGNAIFSKFKITQRHEPIFFNEPFSDNYVDDAAGPPIAPRNLEHVVIDVNGVAIDLFNFQGVWDLDGDNYSEKRQHMADVILEETKGKSKVILAGDTNAKAMNKAMLRIADELTSVFGTTATTTFNMKHKDNPGYATAAVDHMFVSKDIEIVDAQISDADVSDHLSLVVTLRV